MKIAGVVCEYNPIHNGHVYQLEQTRKAGATHIVCVMSGNFVQRGEPSYVDKFIRAEAAIHCGADLVVDLPVPWSCDSAENFAFGAVSLLNAIGIDMLSFGSEISDTALLKKCAESIDDEKVGALIKSKMACGKSYPSALSLAVEEVFGSEAASVINMPNSTLAIEYIRALKRLNSPAEIFAVKRKECDHDSTTTSDFFASAAAIRSMDDFTSAKNFMPEYAYEKISEAIENGYVVDDVKKYERTVLSALRSMSLSEIQAVIQDESGISQRIHKALKTACSIDELLNSAKTKSMTMARLRRCIIRLMLKIPADISKKSPPYIRVLAANRKGAEIICRSDLKLPLIMKYNDILKQNTFS
ncbi:MAG: nucleotidyltransferase family protein, partial [Ruminococcus sp.]|nr:nucleotidyltransferase family protein [Ruminococcus sp.]